MHSPEVIPDFSTVPQHNDAAGRETEKVLYVVLADDWVQVHAIHVQPLDPLEVRHLGGGRRHVAMATNRGGRPQSRMRCFHLQFYPYMNMMRLFYIPSLYCKVVIIGMATIQGLTL